MDSRQALSAARDKLAEVLHAQACEYLRQVTGFIPFAAGADGSYIRGVPDDRFEEDMDDRDRVEHLVGVIDHEAAQEGYVAAAVCFPVHGGRADTDEVQEGVMVLAYSIDGEMDAYRGGFRNAGSDLEFDPIVKMEQAVGVQWGLPVVESWASQDGTEDPE